MELNKIYNGDSIEVMKGFPDNSIDSVVTDSPYGLSFMNKHWDTLTSKNLYEFVLQWSAECFRVLKPGGYLLSFGGTRTYHRMTCAIEDAGFEIRDCIMWLYGSGFPKSLDIGKAIDKINGELIKSTYIPNDKNKVYGNSFGGGITDNTLSNNEWNGYGTALKPACEPIVVARKPISEKTVAENVLKWGTGGINIDGCRVETSETIKVSGDKKSKQKWKELDGRTERDKNEIINTPYEHNKGRFPANIILDEEAGAVLDEMSGETKSSNAIRKNNRPIANAFGKYNPDTTNGFSDSGGASRFFYCAKSSRSERNKGCEEIENKCNHPTVKPISLMRYLVRLVTPKNGICLDPFGGSGTTGIACVMEDVNYILIEKEIEYAEICKARIKAVEKDLQLKLAI